MTDAFKRPDAIAPPRTFTVEPELFSPKWSSRPKEAVCCGIRPLGIADDEFCRTEAAKRAWRLMPGKVGDGNDHPRNEIYNESLMCFAIVRGTCDANDATKSWDLWRGVGEDVVFPALARGGAKALWIEVEAVTLSTSPIQRQAEDEDIDEIFVIAADALARMPAARAARARRLLNFVLEECRAFPAPSDKHPASVTGAASGADNSTQPTP